MKNLAEAIIKVMNDVKGIDKTTIVGSGASAYKGVPDQEVKKVIGESMAKHGLVILPLEVEPKTEVSRWEETTNYNNVPSVKQKQSVFTEVKTKYLLLHTSGECQIISGYGHGVDSQDKSAGKATTYALKYALLYTFLVPTGKIDDTDVHHSDSIDSPKNQKPVLQPSMVAYQKAIDHLKSGGAMEDVKKQYQVTPQMEKEIITASQSI